MNNNYFTKLEGDIFKVRADALAFSANPLPLVYKGNSLESQVYKCGGKRLFEQRRRIGQLKYGDLKVTEGFDSGYKFLFHVVTPFNMDGKYGERAILKECYKKCIKKASEMGLQSIAFPLLGTRMLEFGALEAYDIASESINEEVKSLKASKKFKPPKEIFLVCNENWINTEIDIYEKLNQNKELRKYYNTKDFTDICDESYIYDVGDEYEAHIFLAKLMMKDRDKQAGISKEIKKEKESFLAENPKNTEDKFIKTKISDTINKWLDSEELRHSKQKYARTGRNCQLLAIRSGLAESTVTQLSNMTGPIPARNTMIKLAIGMNLSTEERIRFILYANENLKYPHSNLEKMVEQGISLYRRDHGSCLDVYNIDEYVLYMTKKRLINSPRDRKSKEDIEREK